MILIVCSNCMHAIRVTGEDDETNFLVGEKSEFWPDKFTCYHCFCTCSGVLETEATPEVLRALDIVELNPQEAYAAIQGLGLPKEKECRFEMIARLFKEHPVKAVRGQDITGTSRCAIYDMELNDGTRVYFAASTHGAIVYRVVLPHSYTEAARG